MRGTKMICMALAAVCLAGCSNSGELKVTPVSTPAATVVTTSQPQKQEFGVGDKISIMQGEQQWGTAQINQIQKVRFGDWSNENARKHSINYCYSINLTLKSTKETVSALSVNAEPFFERNGDKISSIANLGWNGFPSSAEFYDGGSHSATIEVCVQPEELLQKGDILRLKISGGMEENIAKVKTKAWRKAKKGPKLHKANEVTKIKSACKAVYSIVPQSVHFEEHYLDYQDIDHGSTMFFDVNYQVCAYKPPTKGKSVASIVGTGKQATITCRAAIGLQPQNSASVLYECNKNAGRIEYTDSDDLHQYVSEGQSLRFGFKRNVTTNRMAEDATNKNIQYVRLRVEFPEEFDAMSLKQKLNFNGRYLVYEIPITSRKLEKYFD